MKHHLRISMEMLTSSTNLSSLLQIESSICITKLSIKTIKNHMPSLIPSQAATSPLWATLITTFSAEVA